MFWRFGGYANISTLDSILDKQDVTLEELLEESDLIQELKSQNAKLIEYLRDSAILERLLKYVIAEKPPDSPVLGTTSVEQRKSGGLFGSARSKGRSKSRGENDETDQEKSEKQRMKYAYVSCEILSSEVWSITEALLESPEILRSFWNYIAQVAPLDPLQAGYFTKVNESLLEKRPDAMVAFIRTLDGVVENMMKHVDCPTVMDLLLKLISLEKTESCQGVVDWLQSQNLIPLLLSYITPEHPASTQTSAGDFLKAIITISANATGQDSSVIGPNELTRQLVSEQCVESLVGEMVKGGNPLTVGVGIIIEVIRKNNSDYDSDNQTGAEPKSSDPIYLGTLLRILSTHVPQFMELILSPNHTVATETGSKTVPRLDMKVAWGDKIEPLGFDRFKTCELMAELLHCSNMGLLNEKGAEALIKQRDAERERLKEAGNLGSARPTQGTDEFGTSLDSSGFHHAETFTPLGESPERIKRLEVQNNGEEEEFEKVTMTEAEAEGEDFRDILEADEDQPSQEEILSEGQASRQTIHPPRIESLVNQTNQLNLENQATMSSATSMEPAPLNVNAKPTSSASSSRKRNVSSLARKIEKMIKERLEFSAGTEPALDSAAVNTLQNITEANVSLYTDDANPEKPNTSGSNLDSSQEEGSQSATHEPPKEAGIQSEEDGSPVVGDLLKIMFVEHRVVPMILDFFFRFPWNNFLHNVVYDVVQQVFNGTMERGYNRNLAIDLFDTGRITNRIVEGQQRSEEAQEARRMRLGYMGHLTLIAEEVVKFTERQPPDLLSQSVVEKIMDPDWIHYVEHTLAETRDRDNAILGGVRPDVSVGPRQAVLNAVNGGNFGGVVSAALANAGLSGTSTGLDSMDLANSGAEGYNFSSNALLSGFGSSDEEEDDEPEEGEVGDASAHILQQLVGDDSEQSQNTILSTDRDPGQSEDSNNTPLVPAPLAIAPSRARRQLAMRLAAKQQRQDNNEDPSSASGLGTSTLSSTTTTAPVSGATTSSSLGLAPNAALSAERSDEDEDDDDDDDGLVMHSGSEDEGTRGKVARRRAAAASAAAAAAATHEDDDEEEQQVPRLATREAVQRRPLDLGPDDDDDHAEGGDTASSAASTGDESSDDGGRGAATSSRSKTASLQTPSKESSSADEAAAAKRREQEKLLQQWGLSSDDEVETEEDDGDDEEDDAEDEPVEMGSKYMKRMGSRDSNKE